ncbi:MAG: NADH-quinone oxidoreductase subunit C [Actinomycetota bacterium]
MSIERVAARLEQEQYIDTLVARGEVTTIVEPGGLLESLEWLRDEDDLSFDSLSDITITDWPKRDPRFWIAYHLYSHEHRHRVRLKVGLPADAPVVPTVTGLFAPANWMEREVFDMMGVTFDGHPDLRRILMPEDWEDFPQRKTESLGGVPTRYKGAFIPPVDERIGEA